MLFDDSVLKSPCQLREEQEKPQGELAIQQFSNLGEKNKSQAVKKVLSPAC
jgi:hypothetical protein